MSKKILSIILIIAVALVAAVALTACNKPFAIPEDLTIDIEIYNGETKLGTVTRETLEGVKQENVEMATTNSVGTEETSVFVAYSFKAIAEKLNIELPSEISSVKVFASDGYKDVFEITSLDNAYISIGFMDGKEFSADEKAPRFISDKTSKSRNSIAKFAKKIIINPLPEEEGGDEGDGGQGGENEGEQTLAYILSLTWENENTLKIDFEDRSGDSVKYNTLALSTPNADGETKRNIDGKGYTGLGSNLYISYEHQGKNGTTTYYGYKLGDILANLGNVEDYTVVMFVCSDDKETDDYSARAYTKAEVDSNDGVVVAYDKGNGKARIMSALGDTNPSTYRNNLKNVTTINIYIEK
ncbi:MAG: hypothetical protein GX095_07190 [Clostridiales bacterium]|nr:hypothetical protein [Clostridiales bacterium]